MSFLPGLFAGALAAVGAPFLPLLAFLAVSHENAKNVQTKSRSIPLVFKICWFK